MFSWTAQAEGLYYCSKLRQGKASCGPLGLLGVGDGAARGDEGNKTRDPAPVENWLRRSGASWVQEGFSWAWVFLGVVDGRVKVS